MQFNVCPLDEIDFYKAGHYAQYPENTVEIYSNFTPRTSRSEMKQVIVAGVQMVLQDIHENWKNNFFNLTKEEITEKLQEYQEFMDASIYKGAVTIDHILSVWKLGYLPLEVRAIPEGTLVDVGVPVLTIRNTHEDAFWLVNYLETKLSNSLWKPITSATTAFQYLKKFHEYAEITGANKDFIQWQGHDFSYRGMSGNEDAIASGLSHLMAFTGTDTVPAIKAAKYYGYGDWRNELIGASVVATEHSVMCAGSKDGELDTFKRLLTKFPTNILSVVSDTWDYWQVITKFLPELKDRIMARNGRLVVRPDSGDPVRIIAGYPIVTDVKDGFCCYTGEDFVHFNGEHYILYEAQEELFGEHESQGVIPEHVAKGSFQCLWETFGGTINDKGYKVLDTHIGLLYGDSITLKRQEEILRRLEKKGFTADNLVLGIGSFTYEYVTRDTFGMAMKATNIVKCDANGYISEPIFKDPKTQAGKSFSKTSAKGYLKVIKTDLGLALIDGLSFDEMYVDENLLQTVYLNGEVTEKTTLAEIRNRVKSYL